jgi:hypothetical protein
MSSFETSSATFGDFNQDGTLDIFREGNGMGETSAIYQNESCVSNSPPTIPAGLTATILNCDSVRLDWQAVSDDHTLASNITYEIYVGSSPAVAISYPKKPAQTAQHLLRTRQPPRWHLLLECKSGRRCQNRQRIR